MIKPKLSVIMSVYNGEKYLNEAIDSILNQTFKDFEFIIIDDASSDKTLSIIKQYNDKDKRIVLIQNEKNIGLTKSLNKGIKLAKGDYIARMDADDVSKNERFQYQIDFLQRNQDITIVGTYMAFIDKNGKKFKIWKTPLDHENIREELKHGSAFCHGSVMIRRDAMLQIEGYREKIKYSEDYDCWLRLTELYKGANINKILYLYRTIPEAISKNKLSEMTSYCLLAYELSIEREKTGKDSLENMEINNIDAVLKNYFCVNKKRIKKYKAESFFKYAEDSLGARNYLNAFKLFIKGLSFKIEIKQVRIFLVQLIKQLIYS